MNIALATLSWCVLLFQVPGVGSGLFPPQLEPKAEVHFRLASGYLIHLDGRIATTPNLTFLLDTGSTISIVDEHIAASFQSQSREAEALNFDKKLRWKVVEIPELHVGPIDARNAHVFVGHLKDYSDFAENVDAIIGLDLLSRTDFTIDYDAEKIIFNPHRGLEMPPASPEPISRCIVVDGSIQQHRIRLLVDTGFPALLLYRDRLMKQIPKLTIIGNPKPVLIGKTMKANQVQIPDLIVKSRNINTPVLLVNSSVPAALSDIDGVIGPSVLKAHKLHFDLRHRTVEWE